MAGSAILLLSNVSFKSYNLVALFLNTKTFDSPLLLLSVNNLSPYILSLILDTLSISDINLLSFKYNPALLPF